MKTFIKEYAKLLRFTKGYRGMLVVAGLFMGISTIFECAQLGAIVPICDRIFTHNKIVIPGGAPTVLVPIIDKINSLEPILLLKYLVVIMPLLFLFKGVVLIIQSYLMNLIGQGAVKKVRNQLYAKFQDLSLDFYANKRVGELISRITHDVGIITNSISYALRDLVFESLKVIAYGYIAFSLSFRISWKLSIFAFIIFPSIMFPVIRITKRIKKFTIEIQNKMADLNSILSETIQGAYIVKAFSREKYEMERFEKINNNYYKYTLKNIKRIIVISPLTEFIGVTGTAFILWIVGKEVIAGNLSFGIFGLFLATLLSIMSPIKKLANVHAINQQALSASDRIYKVLDEKPKVVERENPIELKDFKGEIKFDKIWFKYEDEYVLSDISLDVKKGEVIAIVGHSGAGKSTLIGLLPRLYDAQKGTITFDGIDTKDYSLTSLRKFISVVSQEMVLFNATVKDNIGYGRDGATEEEILSAAKHAHADEFIENMPKGFSSIIGDRGFKLSGGERQRISIARAILKNSPILVLDEATSSLDSKSEKLIKDALYYLMEGKTSFIIAHRLSTIQRADRIIVLEKGRIVEIGTHDFLVKKGGLYKKLYDLQFSA